MLVQHALARTGMARAMPTREVASKCESIAFEVMLSTGSAAAVAHLVMTPLPKEMS